MDTVPSLMDKHFVNPI